VDWWGVFFSGFKKRIVMSKIIEAMKKAKLLREQAGKSSNDSVPPKKTISWLTLMHVLGMFIVLIVFYVYSTDNKPQELNLISDRLGQVEYKLAQIVDNQNLIKAAMVALNKLTPTVSVATTTIPEKTTPVIKETASVKPKEIIKPVEKYHVVKTGETLYRISKRYGKSVDEVRRLNRLKQNQSIKMGQKLMIE
jgi:LysM repeat protein